MAASEPPEPPPRNPDKINASLKQTSSNDLKSTKSLDSPVTTPLNNNSIGTTTNAALKTNMSMDAACITAPSALAANKATTSPTTMTPVTTSSSSSPPPTTSDMGNGNHKGGSGGGNDSTSPTSNTIALNSTASDATNDKKPAPKTGVAVDAVASGRGSSNTLSTAGAVVGDVGCAAAAVNGAAGGVVSGVKPAGRIEASKENGESNSVVATTANEIKLRLENERLIVELAKLKRLFEYSEDGGAVGGAVELTLSDSNSLDAHSTDGSSSRIERLEMELKMAKEHIQHLRTDRRKLRADKTDLLAHVKQMCASLQDKERELRDFIRNYEQRIGAEADGSTQAKVASEREQERWSLMKHARDEAERSVALATQLTARDAQLHRLQEQLLDARRQLATATGQPMGGGLQGAMSDQESLLSFAPLTPPSGGLMHTEGGGASMVGTLAGPMMREQVQSDGIMPGQQLFAVHLGDGQMLKDVDVDSISLVSSHHNMYQFHTPKDRSPTQSPINFGSFQTRPMGPTSTCIGGSALSRSVEHLGSPLGSDGGNPTAAPLAAGGSACGAQSAAAASAQRRLHGSKAAAGMAAGCTSTLGSRSGRGGTWGSISRVFARSRHRGKNSTAAATATTGNAGGAAFLESIGAAEGGSLAGHGWTVLTEESYAEKLRLLREASAVPMDRWRASQVLAWLEVALGMPQYSSRCAENVKSGKVLLELNDGELETGLGLTHPMHRKKMRLAIEEQRRPELMRYPTIGQLGHVWVTTEWLPDIGLPQYADSFMHSLVDARMLDTLSKKELEKFLSVTRKFHQASIVHGIHVLRILKYDREALALRRMQCENVDADPIVWTNQRFIRWACSIDLGEYADNLKDSGVHGGLVVLEPSFSGDTIATALGIPPSKNIIRRHLNTEFDALVLPARAQLGQGIRMGGGSVMPITGPGGLQQHHNSHASHGQNSVDRRASGSFRFSSWRGSQGSLYKAFGFNTTTKSRRSDPPAGTSGVTGRSTTSGHGGTRIAGSGNSTSPTPSYSSSSETGIYATIGPSGGLHYQQQNNHQQQYKQQAAHYSHYRQGGGGGGGMKHAISSTASMGYTNGIAGGYAAGMPSSSVTGVGSGGAHVVGQPHAPPPSHRVSAPPMEAAAMHAAAGTTAEAADAGMPEYAQHHRRVKSISDIETVAATPV